MRFRCMVVCVCLSRMAGAQAARPVTAPQAAALPPTPPPPPGSMPASDPAPAAAGGSAAAPAASSTSGAASAPAGAAPPSVAAPASGKAPPEARRGFQMYFVPLTAVAFPFGNASGNRGDQLGARYSWQWVPLELGLGAKLIDPLYVGAYLDLGVGYEGSDSRVAGRCEAGDGLEDDVSCSSVTVHAGFEVQYSFTPADAMTGWLGYGVGITTGSQTISDAGRYSETSTSRGIDLARLSGGLNFRAKRGFGLGPFAIASIGRYTHQRTEINNVQTFSGDIDDPDLHVWLTLGLRMVIFP